MRKLYITFILLCASASAQVDLGFKRPFVPAANSIDGSKIALGSDATGDLMRYDGTNWVRLPIGTANQFLKVNSGGTGHEWFTRSYGSMSISNGAVVVAVTQNVFAKVTGFTGRVNSSDVTVAGVCMKVTTAGTYMVYVSVAFEGGFLADIFRYNLRVNNVAQTDFQGQMGIAVINTTGTANFTGIYTVSANSGFSLWVTNTATSNDPTIRQGNVVILRLI